MLGPISRFAALALVVAGCASIGDASGSPSGTTGPGAPLSTTLTDTSAVTGLSCPDRVAAGLTASCELDWELADGRFTSAAPLFGAVAMAGDVSGDGLGDVLIGEGPPSTPHPDPAGWLVNGPAVGAVPLEVAANLVYPLDALVPSLAQPAGDTNGDGVADLWVPGAEAVGHALHLFHGPAPVALDPAQAAATFADYAGVAWSRGDLDGDGIVDALLPDADDPDGAFLFRGPLLGAFGPEDATLHLFTYECGGMYAEDLGDLDGDGVHELYVGARGACDHGPRGVVVAATYAGESPLIEVTSPVATVSGGADHVRAAGDVNGDGLGDVAVVGLGDGVAISFGPVAGELASDGVADLRWTHPTGHAHDVVAVGDLDGDGADELGVVFYDDQTMRFDLYVVPGGRTGTWDASVEWSLHGGDRPVDTTQLSARSDVDGDGVGDLVVAALTEVIVVSLGARY